MEKKTKKITKYKPAILKKKVIPLLRRFIPGMQNCFNICKSIESTLL